MSCRPLPLPKFAIASGHQEHRGEGASLTPWDSPMGRRPVSAAVSGPRLLPVVRATEGGSLVPGQPMAATDPRPGSRCPLLLWWRGESSLSANTCPKLFKLSWCEGNIKTVQCILYVPASKNAIALIIGF